MISVRSLSKDFEVHRKRPGLAGSIRSLVKRDKIVKQAVREVSFEVAEGEILGLVGANGAGKTTLVMMLAGIIHPTAGEAEVLGFTPWERSNAFRRQIALIMGQKAQLWWDLPAADCFLLLREIYQIPRARYEADLAKLAKLLRVEEELEIQIRRLSLGERMKMELIAALLHSPKVVFLDEPTIGLDLSAQRAIRDFILEYRRERTPAMIVTSHYMEDIERLCERIVILRRGEVVYDGSLERVVEEYTENKIVSAQLAAAARRDPPDGDGGPDREALARLGEVLELSDLKVSLCVPRSEVAEAAGWLLEHLPVSDLQIEEEDVGTIVERIMREDAAGAAAGEDGGRRSAARSAPGEEMGP
ncbi:MAG: ATP-binding cassette domain-containing protein [Thermoanaerobaculia bacterium]|nr:ATP-binding cassette domain-containing protein [Thermoanaerobaculia bacterium]